jgi:hypothetical protein
MAPAIPVTKAEITKEYNFNLKTFIPQLAAVISLSRIAANPDPSFERRIYRIRKIDAIPIARVIQ